MRTIKDCVPILEQKSSSLNKVLSVSYEDEDQKNSRIVNAEIFSSELQDIIGFLNSGEEDFGCEVVPKEQFQQITKMAEIVRLEYDGLFCSIASCSRFPIENPFFVVFSENLDDALNFSI
jgi:hypothetical protein